LWKLFGQELLKEQEDPTFNREIGKLENSVIYKTLYPFQQKGVLSLIKMLQNYNGAILADAVGLGKTWSALAVIKYFQLQGYENILLCPKKLQNNWQQYLKKRGSLFEADNFDFIIRFHTDLFEKRLEKDGLTINDYFQSDKPKLLIIDESHNLRNAKSNRYKFLVENILKKNQNIKVLLLSATPINNSLNDIKNQFKLIVKNNDCGFYDTLGINSIDGVFKRSQTVFNRWIETDNKHISTFIKELPLDFFRLTDSLSVARTRNMIDGLKFPKKHSPKNIYISPKNIGEYKTFAELFENLPPKLTAYKPAFYIDDNTKDVTKNEKLRDKALVKMIYMLLVKRFESSWKSFYDTIIKIQAYHENIYNMDDADGLMVHAYAGSDNYAWDNTRNPAGEEYQGNAPELYLTDPR
jgi:Rad3-related DNA helicase